MIKSANGFMKMTVEDFDHWITSLNLGRKVVSLQLHHTWRPNYSSFNGKNHFDIQDAMKNYHVNNNKWDDIGQHFTIFPDGIILTGRSLENDPAGIFGFNKNSVCIENVGDFDKNRDEMTTSHSAAIIQVTAMLCRKFSISVNSDKIVYHHWFNISTGERDNGLGENNKSCPGTNFFGGNTVEDCETNFFPLVSNMLNSAQK